MLVTLNLRVEGSNTVDTVTVVKIKSMPNLSQTHFALTKGKLANGIGVVLIHPLRVVL